MNRAYKEAPTIGGLVFPQCHFGSGGLVHILSASGSRRLLITNTVAVRPGLGNAIAVAMQPNLGRCEGIHGVSVPRPEVDSQGIAPGANEEAQRYHHRQR